MSAHEQMRQMLDQLMGTGRDGENNRFKVHFTDHRVCKSFLVGCCPHDILASTRMDMGECHKIHDLALRADYEKAAKDRDYYYDVDATDHLEAFIKDCDKRTEQAKRRLAETQEELTAEVAAKALKVHELAEQIGKKLARAEELGAEGNVEESLKYMEEVEDIRKKKAAADQEYRNSMPASSYQQQKLRVCEVCSAYLGIHDNDRRLADHFGGKLHLGFIKIRDKLDDLRKTIGERKEKVRLEREREREEAQFQRRDWGGPRGDRGDEQPPRGRSRSRSRGRSNNYGGRRSRSRSRSRDRRNRRRSRSRSPRHRSSREDSRDRRRDGSRCQPVAKEKDSPTVEEKVSPVEEKVSPPV